MNDISIVVWSERPKNSKELIFSQKFGDDDSPYHLIHRQSTGHFNKGSFMCDKEEKQQNLPKDPKDPASSSDEDDIPLAKRKKQAQKPGFAIVKNRDKI